MTLLLGCDHVFLSQRGDAGVTADASLCAGGAYSGTGGLLEICLASMPAEMLVRDSEILTSARSGSTEECAEIVAQPDEAMTEVCVVAARRIEIDGPVRAAGSRPLVMLALDELVVTATGSIDVAGHRIGFPAAGSDSGECDRGNGSTSGTGAAGGGGAGGSFATLGAMGGSGSSGTAMVSGGGTPFAPLPLTIVRGGCMGGLGGRGASNMNIGSSGRSGGAVYLLAGRAITIAGTIDASGGGGGGGVGDSTGAGGGGGGGSGGLIALDAPAVTFAATAVMVANGGGGAGGGGGAALADGTAGEDPDPALDLPFTASGGSGGGTAPTAGGTGGAGATLVGGPAVGMDGGGGGGGGGGGLGYVKIYASRVNGQDAARISPLPTP